MKSILMKPWKHKLIRENPDREWQTRRVIKPQPIPAVIELKEHSEVKGYWIPYAADRRMVNNNIGYRKDDCGYKPKYQVGEIVYIKEAYWQDQSGGLWDYKFDTGRGENIEWPVTICGGKAVPPLFMPAWAARTFVKILDVRAERLQEITLEDCIAEGHPSDGYPHMQGTEWQRSHVMAWYKNLWDSINPKYPWESNCWVWRYVLKVVKQ